MSNKKKIKVKKKEVKEPVDPLTLSVRESLGSMGKSVAPAQEKMLVAVYKMFLVGGISTIIDFVIFILLSIFTKLDPMIVNAISFAIAFFYGLWSGHKYIFQGKKPLLTEYLVLRFLDLFVTEGILFGLVSMLSWNSILVKFLTIIVVIILKILMRKFVFHPKKNISK